MIRKFYRLVFLALFGFSTVALAPPVKSKPEQSAPDQNRTEDLLSENAAELRKKPNLIQKLGHARTERTFASPNYAHNGRLLMQLPAPLKRLGYLGCLAD